MFGSTEKDIPGKFLKGGEKESQIKTSAKLRREMPLDNLRHERRTIELSREWL